MSLNHKAGLIAASLLVALGVIWMAFRASQRSRYESSEPTNVSRSLPPNSSKPKITPLSVEPKTPVTAENSSQITPITTRRDVDFWPQLPHPISLRQRTITPSKTIAETDRLDPARHTWLAQFGGPLSDADKTNLRENYQIETLSLSSDMCVYVRASATHLLEAADESTPKILGWARLNPDDKIIEASFPNGDPRAVLRVELHPNGDLRRVTHQAVALGGRVQKSGANWFSVESAHARSFALRLAALDDVYMIESIRRTYIPHNANAEANSNVTPLFSSPFNLTGSGITIMVRDEGRVFAHPDFGTRIQFGPDVAASQPVQHATHVAGTIGGSGVTIPGAGTRGFAPGCTIVSYDLSGDESSEPIQALQSFGAAISNHSYGFLTGWDNGSGTFTNNQATFGLYASFARNWDGLARSQNLILIKSAGNARDGTGVGHPHNGLLATDGDYYNTIDQSGTSKNVLVVGAVSDSTAAGSPVTSKRVLSFSSSGPTSDGRLRPEIVADGDALLSCDNTPVTGNTYVALSGTSMAAAAVTGSTALFMQRYKQILGASASCPPHVIRAVYAQTATDLGTPGPDYLHGFGILDAAAAIALLNADSGLGLRIATSSISASTPERFFLISSDGSIPIKATLCWSDDPGDALATKSLVNDLDVRLIKADDQSVSYPFVLNPNAPAQAAAPGINTIDTIEQVLVASAPPGNYLFAIRASTLISSMPFALASSHTLTQVLPPTPAIQSTATVGPPPFDVNFDGTNSVAAQGSALVQYIWSFGDGASATGTTVQHTYVQGVYQATLKVIDNKGASASTSVIISVANKSPVAALAVSPSTGGAPLTSFFNAGDSSDPDGTIMNFAFDFGDGSNAIGSTATHTYMTPGLYTPRITVTDNGGATNSKTATVFVGESFAPTAAHFGLNFSKSFRDTFTLSTRSLPIAPNIDTTGLQGTVRVGQASYTFILDSKGNYTSPVLKVKLLPLKAQLSIRLAQTNLLGAMSFSNVSNTTVKSLHVSIPFAVNFGNTLSYGSSGLPFSYTAKQGVSGSGTFIKN